MNWIKHQENEEARAKTFALTKILHQFVNTHDYQQAIEDIFIIFEWDVEQ